MRAKRGTSMIAGVIRAQDEAAAWNTAHPVGTRVRYWGVYCHDRSGPHEGEGVTLRPAQRLGGIAAVQIDGVREMVQLSLIEAVE